MQLQHRRMAKRQPEQHRLVSGCARAHVRLSLIYAWVMSTVIMGESCGVRTMVWGFESPSPSPNIGSQTQQTQQSTQQHTQQNHPSAIAGTSSNNEEAAQLLLSLGQSRTNELRPMQSQPTMRSQHPLNMERLWAGDYSQLPAGQQMHALNLSAQQQWGGPIQPMKVSFL